MTRKRKLNTENRNDVVDKYLIQMESTVKIAKDFYVYPSTINRILKARNVILRNHSAAQRLKNHTTTNDECFNNKSSEMLYWIGFLMADGGIEKNRVCLGLALKDKNHVKKFRTFVNGSQTIRTYKNMASIVIVSRHIVRDLAACGVVERKSLTASASDSVRWSRDFWRGVIDGDGSIRKNGEQLSLYGSHDICCQFLEFLQKQKIARKCHVRPLGNIFQVGMGGKTSKAAINILYKNAKTFLDRKMKQAQFVFK